MGYRTAEIVDLGLGVGMETSSASLIGSDSMSMGRISTFLELLTGVPDGDTVARALAAGVLMDLRAHVTCIYRLSDTGRDLLLVGKFGGAPDQVRALEVVPLDLEWTVGRAFHRDRVLLEAIDDIRRSSPLTAPLCGADVAGSAGGTLAVLPLHHAGVSIGVLTTAVEVPLRPGDLLADQLELLAPLISLWLLAAMSRDRLKDRQTEKGRRVLTDRQLQVLQLMDQGLNNGEIARVVGYSEPTIKADISALYRLVPSASRSELLANAARAGLLTVDLRTAAESSPTLVPRSGTTAVSISL